MSTTLKLVLDTNVVLDWLVFNEPGMSTLQAAIQQGQLVLLTHQAAMDELRRVLNYPTLQLSTSQQTEIFARYRNQTSAGNASAEFGLQNLLLPAGFPRCSDPDDQHFLALAFHSQADALVSRDKAVLTLCRRAEKFGLKILDTTQLITLFGKQ